MVNQRNSDIPLPARAIERGTLLRKLQAVQQHKITLVSAPPGYGKTTTVATFAHQCDMPCAWHSIEETERDLLTLYQHSLKALEYVAPGISTVEPHEGVYEYISHIASYIRTHVSHHIMYVLDDLQLVAGSPSIERWLQGLVAQLPGNCHLVLISRVLPDLPLAEYIARGEVLAIGQDELRFTATEADLLARTFGYSLAEHEIQHRIDMLEGWPAGLVLALQPLPAEFQFKGGPEAVFDALAETMLQKQPPLVRDFLLSSSVLSRLTPELCTEALDLPNSIELLDTVVRRNLFAARTAGGITYHRLFRNFLQTRLSQSDSALYRQLHTQAAYWFQVHDDHDEAFYHYIAAGATESALSIVDRVHRVYFNQGRFETLLNWRNLLGDQAIQCPRLIYTCAMIHIDRAYFDQAERELTLAEQVFRIYDNDDGLADVQMQRAMILLRNERYDEVIGAIANHVSGRARHLLALAYMGKGQLERAIQHLEAIAPTYEEEQDAYALSIVLQDLEVAYTRAGRMQDASRCLQRVVAIRRDLGRPDALALALNNLGYHYHQRGNYREAFAAFEEGLDVVSQVADRRTECYLLWSLADLYRDLGHFDQALQLYNRAYELSQETEAGLRRSITLSMSTLYRWQGQYAQAEKLARSAINGHASEYSLAEAAAWTARALAQETPEAFNYLQHLQVNHHNPQIAAWTAVVAVRYNDPQTAEMCLNSINPEAAQPIVAEIRHSPLLRDFIQTQRNYRGLLRMAHQSGTSRRNPRLSVHTTAMPYSLRVHALGIERIERDGERIPGSAWRSLRAREFFLYLVFQEPRRREDISLEFWPESSVRRVRSNFHTTLYRARQAVGEETIIFDGDFYRLNPEIDVHVDAYELRRLVQDARLLSHADAGAEDLRRKAVALYQGELLPSLDAHWVTIHRTALQELYIEALMGLGYSVQARYAYREAIETFQRILLVDPFRESAYRALITCYAALGEHRSVLWQYEEMQTLFKTELGILPSPETLSLMNNLLRS